MAKILILSAVVFTLACFPDQGLAKTETLVYGTTEKVIDMDPANAYDFHTWEIFYNIYQGLLTYPPGKTDLTPELAKSYDISADGKEYTFKLRTGLKPGLCGRQRLFNTPKWSNELDDGCERLIINETRQLPHNSRVSVVQAHLLYPKSFTSPDKSKNLTEYFKKKLMK
ncbi:MAG: hypothetical protein JRI95_10040 [Deltaproteobacteria bacterium]|nr:hypothetical protein [Deltaproteobacteria bacterium]MBW2087171.1 hypothetical protein [Deltaproteobacteria bacterium]